MEENSAQNVTIEQQKKITMTAVESVDGFTAQQITLTLSGGGRAIITGEGLKIIHFPNQTEISVLPEKSAAYVLPIKS